MLNHILLSEWQRKNTRLESDIEKQKISCPVCLENFDTEARQPYALSCPHMVCAHCLYPALEKDRDESRNSRNIQGETHPSKHCPICRTPVVSPLKKICLQPWKSTFWIRSEYHAIFVFISCLKLATNSTNRKSTFKWIKNTKISHDFLEKINLRKLFGSKSPGLAIFMTSKIDISVRPKEVSVFEYVSLFEFVSLFGYFAKNFPQFGTTCRIRCN